MAHHDLSEYTPQQIADYEAGALKDGTSKADADTQIENGGMEALAATGGGKTSPLEKYKVGLAQESQQTSGFGVSQQLLHVMAPAFGYISGLSNADQEAALAAIKPQVATQYLPQAQDADRQARHAAFKQYWQTTYALPLVQGLGPTAQGQLTTTNQALSAMEGDYESKYDSYYDGSQGWRLPADQGFADFFVRQAQATGVMGDARPDLDPASPYYQSAKGVIQQQVNVTVQVAQQKAAQVKAVQGAVTRAHTNLLTLTNALGADPDVADTNALSAAFDDLTDPYLVQGYQQAALRDPALTADQFIGGVVAPHVQQQLGSDPKYKPALAIDPLGRVDLTATAAGVKGVQKAEVTAATATRNQQDWQATVDSAVAQGKIKPEDAAGVLKKAGVDASGQPNYTAARTSLAGTIAVNADATKDKTDQGNLDGTLAKFKALHPNVNVSSIDTKKLLADAGGDYAVADKNLTAATDTAGKAQANTQTFGLGQPGVPAVPAVPATPGTGNYDPTRAPGAESVSDVQMGKYSKSPTGPGSYSHSYDLTRLSAPTQAALAAGQSLTVAQAQEVAQANRGFRNIYSGASDENGPGTLADKGKGVVSGLWQQANGDAATFHNLLTTHISTGENQAKTEQLDRSTLPGFKTTAEAMNTGPLWTGTTKGPEPEKQTATVV